MIQQAMQDSRAGTVNGVDVDRLFESIDAVKMNPGTGKFRFRAENRWISGGHNLTTITEFYGVGENHRHEFPFELDADEPPVLLGEDSGPNPVQYLLTALAGCLTSSLIYHAAARGITIRAVESQLEGDLDLRGFLGLSEDVPVGYEEIRVKFHIDADIPRNMKEELIRMAQKYSPVFNTIANPTRVTVRLDGN